jgi:pyruvate/2-oxoacid:ferredoxin oxidoreductase beta subunit/Pyruvate/2-oxoacid:ferredoxin oxidoreductase gamma subunit
VISIIPLPTYRNDTPYPFCPGCGHKSILDHLDEALVALQIDPADVVIVSDIGCSGLSDQYFSTSAFHGLHGRSITYATGVKLARPDLTVLVVMGDGGTGIGGAHLLNAARRNIGITVLVFNNFNYGMTGGQHSATTPPGAVTSTTPEGNLERPLDICATVGVNGAAYAWRGTNFDDDLTDRMVDAIRTPGFAVLDIWELCTAYFVRANQFSRRAIESTLDELQLPTGVLYRNEYPEYAAAYRETSAASFGEPALRPQTIRPQWQGSVNGVFHLKVAGSAGGRVRSAVRLVAAGAVRSGLYAAQGDDYPITVKTGHSVSDLALSSEPIDYTGAEHPEALVVLSDDGLRKVAGLLDVLPSSTVLYTVAEFGSIETSATKRVVDTGSLGGRVAKGDLALVVLTAVLTDLGLFPIEALEAAAAEAPFAEANLAAIGLGRHWSRDAGEGRDGDGRE